MKLGLGLGFGIFAAPRRNSTFTPASLAPDMLLGWYDGGDATSVTLSGTTVTQLKDKSSYARHLANSGTSGPSFTAPVMNGRLVQSGGGLTFNGTSTYLSHGAPFMYARGGIAVFAVLSSAPASGGPGFLCEDNTASINDNYHVAAGSSVLSANCAQYIRNHAGAIVRDNGADLGASVFDGNRNLLRWVDIGTQLSAAKNGVAGATPITYARNGTLTLNSFALGAAVRSTVALYRAMTVNEIVICADASKAAQIEAYLLSRWFPPASAMTLEDGSGRTQLENSTGILNIE